ncbi:MAG TPA: zeta toxin family protein [Acidobacteriaceae bacterium]
MPTLTIVAGANGAGKSTLTRSVPEAFQDHPVLDPDAVLKAANVAGIGASSPIDAGRAILRMCEQLLGRQETFLVETTLSGSTYLRMMERAHSLGYKVRLIYVGTELVEINVQRIRDRVLKGGHDVPEHDQRRRYPRSLANLKSALQLADEAALFDNSSSEGHRVIAIKDHQGISWFAPKPRWAEGLNL